MPVLIIKCNDLLCVIIVKALCTCDKRLLTNYSEFHIILISLIIKLASTINMEY